MISRVHISSGCESIAGTGLECWNGLEGEAVLRQHRVNVEVEYFSWNPLLVLVPQLQLGALHSLTGLVAVLS